MQKLSHVYLAIEVNHKISNRTSFALFQTSLRLRGASASVASTPWARDTRSTSYNPNLRQRYGKQFCIDYHKPALDSLEVKYNGYLLFSKLELGGFPNMDRVSCIQLLYISGITAVSEVTVSHFTVWGKEVPVGLRSCANNEANFVLPVITVLLTLTQSF